MDVQLPLKQLVLDRDQMELPITGYNTMDERKRLLDYMDKHSRKILLGAQIGLIAHPVTLLFVIYDGTPVEKLVVTREKDLYVVLDIRSMPHNWHIEDIKVGVDGRIIRTDEINYPEPNDFITAPLHLNYKTGFNHKTFEGGGKEELMQDYANCMLDKEVIALYNA